MYKPEESGEKGGFLGSYTRPGSRKVRPPSGRFQRANHPTSPKLAIDPTLYQIAPQVAAAFVVQFPPR